jgi:hypothetical protein
VGSPFENAITKQKLAYLETFYNRDDNWTSRRTFYIPPEYKPKKTDSRGVTGKDTKVLGNAGELLAANKLLLLADASRTQQADEVMDSPLGTVHTESNANTTCIGVNPIDATFSNVKPTHSYSGQHEDTAVLNPSEKSTEDPNRQSDCDSDPGLHRKSCDDQSYCNLDEDDDAGGTTNDEQEDGTDSDYDDNRDPKTRLSTVEEKRNQGTYRAKEAIRIEENRQVINKLPHLTKRQLQEQKAAIDAQIAATNEKRREEFEELDAELLTLGIGRQELNTPQLKTPTEMELLARTMNEMAKTLLVVVNNQQASKKLNTKKKTSQKSEQHESQYARFVMEERLIKGDPKSGETLQRFGDVDAFNKRYNKKRDGMVKNWIDG